MHRTIRAGALSVLALAGFVAAPAAAQAAEALYGVTQDNRLVRFDSDGPGDVTEVAPIGGLNSGENIVGLDVRPATDQLYAVTSGNRILQVNPTTGATRLFAPTPALSGSLFGVDFNPEADALRIVSDAEQNLRIRFSPPADFTDAPLQYAPGDPGAGTNPTVTASAYTNNTPNAPDTALFGIDSARDTLVRQEPPNAGTLTTVGGLGFDAANAVGFDIAAAGNTAYAALQRQGSDAIELFRIDLSNGSATAATSAATIGADLRAIATAGTIRDDSTAPSVSVAFSSTILESNTNPLKPSVSCNETCTVAIAATIDGRRAGRATETIQGAGRETIEIRLNRAARLRVRRSGTELFRLAIAGVDAAGNRTTQNRVSRTQTIRQRLGG